MVEETPFEELGTSYIFHPDMEEYVRSLEDTEGNKIFPDSYEFERIETEE